MGELYVFGDSFAEQSNLDIDWAWYQIISRKLNYQLQNYAHGGSGLEYIFHKFEEHRQTINNNDIVIICLTSLARTYFFPKIPNLVRPDSLKFMDPKIINEISETEILALKYYVTCFEEIHYEKMFFHLHNFLYNVDQLSSNLKNKILVLDACTGVIIDRNRYKNLQIPHLSLQYVSEAEAHSAKILRGINDKGDLRINHLCKINHSILANKILNFYLNNESIDLSTDFAKDLFYKHDDDIFFK